MTVFVWFRSGIFLETGSYVAQAALKHSLGWLYTLDAFLHLPNAGNIGMCQYI